MTVIIGGSQERALVARLQGTTWWAETGWVHCMHPEEGHSQMRVRDCLQRARALSEMLGNSTEKDLIRYSDLRKELTTFLEDIVEVCQQAREQGEYDDPSMNRDKARRKPLSIAVPTSFQMD